MAYVYRYIDKKDGIIKYIGIVWGKNRTLEQRIKEHEKYDSWCKNKEWNIEFITENINSRTDAEYFEAHYISLFNTDKWYNVKKAGWGISEYLPNRNDWKKIINNEEIIKKLKEQVLILQNELNENKKKLEEKINNNKRTCFFCGYKMDKEQMERCLYDSMKIHLKQNQDYTIDEIITLYKNHVFNINFISIATDHNGKLVCKKQLFKNRFGALIYRCNRVKIDKSKESYEIELFNTPEDKTMKNYNIFRASKNIGNPLFYNVN